MAKKVTVKKVTVEAIPEYQVDNILLMRVDGSQTASEYEGDEDRFLSASIRVTHDEDNDTLVHTSFECGRRGSSKSTAINFSASYVMLLTCNAKPGSAAITAAAKHAASTVAWGHFSNLFYMTSGQMRSRLPVLPANPGKIDVEPYPPDENGPN